MSELDLSYTVEEKTGVLTIDRPPVNAVRYQDIEEILEVFTDVPREDELVLVLRTGGEVFMAGHDYNEFVDFDSEQAEKLKEMYVSFVKSIYECPIPTIVVVDGPAYGVGAVLVSLCDFAIGSSDAEIALAEINSGVIGGYAPLSRVLPDNVVRKMAFTGEPITADRAYAYGLLTNLTDDPFAIATRTAGTIAEKNPDAVRALKKFIIETRPDKLIRDYEREREYIRELRQRPNAQEAAAAFLEDRDPEFTYD